MPVATAPGDGRRCAGLVPRLVEVGNHFASALRHWRYAQDLCPQRTQLRQLGSEVEDVLALHLDAVDAQERSAIARGQGQSVGVVDATEAAVVLGHVQGTR